MNPGIVDARWLMLSFVPIPAFCRIETRPWDSHGFWAPRGQMWAVPCFEDQASLHPHRILFASPGTWGGSFPANRFPPSVKSSFHFGFKDFFFLIWTVCKDYCICYNIASVICCWVFFGWQACGILALSSGTEPALHALEGKVLTTGLPGRCLNASF